MRGLLRSMAMATMSCCFVQVAALSQSADWHGLFRDLISTDTKISEAARSLAFNTLLPALESEDAKALDKDLASIVETFHDENEAIRLQASGLLAGLARKRADATESMKRAVPFWLAQFNDKNPRVRANAISAIANLQPSVPTEVVPELLRITWEGEPAAKSTATLALVRCSGSSADAVRAVADMMSPDSPIETRRVVIQAMGYAGVSDPVLITKLGEALRDRDVVRDALRAIAALGPRAMALRPLLVDLAADDRDKEISDAAATVLKRLEQK